MTAATSASSRMMAADLPPSSRETRFTCSPHRLMIRLPAAVDPVNATLSTPGCVTRCSPASPARRDDADHPARDARLFQRLGQDEVAQRGLRRGLDHDGAACCQRGRGLPGRQGDRRVPRDDHRDHPGGLAGYQARPGAVHDIPLELEIPAQRGVVVEQGGDHPGLRHRRLADRAAHLVDGHAGDVRLPLAQPVSGTCQHLGPLRRRHPRPRPLVEGAPRRRHRPVDVRVTGRRDLPDDLLRRRRDDTEVPAARRRLPGTADEQLPPVHQPVVHVASRRQPVRPGAARARQPDCNSLSECSLSIASKRAFANV